MKVTIITVCYNRYATIDKCMQSVFSQTYKNIEYIVIDGGSIDGTMEVIEKYKNNLAYFVSEHDNGMYDAINKGLSRATGEVVGLLHSDDVFYDNNVIECVVNKFIVNDEIDCLYGNGVYVSANDSNVVIRRRIGVNCDRNNILRGWLPLHTTFYIKRNCLNKFGHYNERWKIASDTEFLLRYLYFHQVKTLHVDKNFIRMNMGGYSTNLKHGFKVIFEDAAIYRSFDINAVTTVFFKKARAFSEYVVEWFRLCK